MNGVMIKRNNDQVWQIGHRVTMINRMVIDHFDKHPKTDSALVLVKEHKKATRSASQNRLYWLWLGLIETETGMPKVDYLEEGKWHKGLHTRFKCDFIVKEFYDDGSMKIPSTKKLNSKDFSNYLERIDMEMANMSINLPHPDDLYYAAMGVKEP
jgi:hypothetical protein